MGSWGNWGILAAPVSSELPDRLQPIQMESLFHRTAMAWQDWAPKVQHWKWPDEEGVPEDGGTYYVEHTDQPIEEVTGLYPRSWVDYSNKPDKAEVEMLYTHPDYRNDGLAEALIRRLHEDHQNSKIDPGAMTDDGQRFLRRMVQKEPEARDLVTARALFHLAQQEQEATGDCYEAAAHYIIDNVLGMGVKKPNHNLRLVHGEVSGQGPLLGRTFGHAWVEDGDTVIDNSNGHKVRMPKNEYYDLGKINDHNNFHVYTPEEARNWLLDVQHYGPWELTVNGEPPPGRMEVEDDDEDDDDDRYWDDDKYWDGY